MKKVISVVLFTICFTFIFPVFNSFSEALVCNCVRWVRANKVSSLPNNLWTINDKRKIINSNTARVGSVAIIDTSNSPKYKNVGHVAYVYKVSGEKIYIEEVNFKPCQYTKRSGTKSSLRIVGFYNPGGGGETPPPQHPSKCEEYRKKFKEACSQKEYWKKRYEETGNKDDKKQYKKWKKEKSKYKEKCKNKNCNCDC